MNTAQELSAEGAKRVFDQQLRIVRQRELVAKLEHHDDTAAMLGRARTVLAGLELSLGELLDAYERVRKNEALAKRGGLFVIASRNLTSLQIDEMRPSTS